MKAKIEDIVEITWMDAAGETAREKEEVENLDPKDLLEETKTYGIFYKEDDEAVIILQEDSPRTVDYTVIPKSLIIETRKLK